MPEAADIRDDIDGLLNRIPGRRAAWRRTYWTAEPYDLPERVTIQ